MSEKKGAEEKKQASCHCPYCDSELATAKYPFCESCGQQLQFCARCGEATERSASTCARCGAPLR